MTKGTRGTGEFPPTHIDGEFAEIIGHIASAWASVELNINIAIWAVAGLSPSLGACLTSQINNLDGRNRALLALLKLRGAPKTLVDQVTKFANDARGPSERRNRIVHDAWMRRQDGTGVIGRLEITAPQKLKMGMIDTGISSLIDDYRYIESFKSRSGKK